MKEMPSWIKSKKDALDSSVYLQQHEVDINPFSNRQRCAYNMVKIHSEQQSPRNPLLRIIIGVAGTGKS